MPQVSLHHADCLDVLRSLPDNSVHSVVTDPPYGLAALPAAKVAETVSAWLAGDTTFTPAGAGFMGRSWDGFVPPPAVWAECLRVLKPGGHLLAFAGSRTQDLMGLSIRLAGFQLRDSVAWVYGTGFPKSLDVGKAIDKQAGATREVVGTKLGLPGYHLSEPGKDGGVLGNGHGLHTDPAARAKSAEVTAPATEAAKRWDGWGTALKPAHEPIIVARKPLVGTVAANVLEHGTGALNIDACRINPGTTVPGGSGSLNSWRVIEERADRQEHAGNEGHTKGRWPANVVLDEASAVELDRQSGTTKSAAGAVTYSQQKSRRGASATVDAGNTAGRREVEAQGYGDEGGASRFFYVAKAPKSERPVVDGTAHPTVKPLTLMRHLVRLVTPEGGTVLEPFAGSGATVEAALLEGFDVIAVEREDTYLPLIAARINRATGAPIPAAEAA